MRQKPTTQLGSSEQVVKDIRRATRKQYSAEEKIRIVLDGLRGEYSIAELCRREGIAESLYYSWSKEFLEAGKRRLAGDTERSASTGEVKELRREVRDDGSIHVCNHQGGAGLRHRLALDIQQRPSQHWAWRDHSRSETETTNGRVSSTIRSR
jgi:transposase